MIYLAWALIFIGFTIRVSSWLVLGKNFSWRVSKPTDITTKGIYKYIRHPMYTGGLIAYTGCVLLATNQLAMCFVFLVLAVNYVIDRIDREEQNMLFHFGEEYWKYMSKTKMLIPYIW